MGVAFLAEQSSLLPDTEETAVKKTSTFHKCVCFLVWTPRGIETICSYWYGGEKGSNTTEQICIIAGLNHQAGWKGGNTVVWASQASCVGGSEANSFGLAPWSPHYVLISSALYMEVRGMCEPWLAHPPLRVPGSSVPLSSASLHVCWTARARPD